MSRVAYLFFKENIMAKETKDKKELTTEEYQAKRIKEREAAARADS